jgi:ribokinase
MIFVVGALHLDVIVTAPRLPALDETLVGQNVRYAMGGKGGNQAVAAARMGASVAMAGRVGSDAFGVQLLAGLRGAGIDVAAVVQGAGASGMSVAIVQAGGEYAAVIVSAENLKIDSEDIEFPNETEILLLQNEVPEVVNVTLAARARSAGVRTVLNAAPARALPDHLLRNLDVLVVNRGEGSSLLGQILPPRQAAKRLNEMGPASVILTLGADGLALSENGQVTILPAHQVQMISAHGAGDAFIGAFAAEWARGTGLFQAASFASAAAALHVSTPSVQQAQINQSHVRHLMSAI